MMTKMANSFGSTVAGRYGKNLLMILIMCWTLLMTGNVARAQSSPLQIQYYVTVRDFMAQACRPFASGPLPRPTEAEFDNHCPNDNTIKNQVKNNIFRGHPDFQRVDYGNKMYKTKNAEAGSYMGKYATFGQPFPVTYDLNPPSATKTKPAVLSDLAYDTAGIPLMQYCKGEEGYACDSSDVAGDKERSIYNEESFSTWHKDSAMYNQRFGFKMTLRRQPSQSYMFDSSKSLDDPYSTNFFSPITENELGGWPLSPLEIANNPNPLPTPRNREKFWFTTEIHNFFEYNGGEVFTFSGDDDVHVFINNRLAINLGGLHPSRQATINVSRYERELGLEKGKIYQFDLFHAERQVTDSNFKMETTLSAACNVVNTDLRTEGQDVETGIDWRVGGPTNDSEWVLISGPGFGTIDSNRVAWLMKSGVPNVASYMFHQQQQNTGSGFSFKFKFQADGNGHGFAVLFHDRDLELHDFNGGTGPNLGVKNTDHSFAIVFDMCPNYPDCSSTTTSQIRLHYKDSGDMLNSVGNETKKKYDNSVIQNWRDNQVHQVEILYYAVPDWLEVYVDNSLRLVERGFDIEKIIGGRDASVGFSSASSTEGSTMNVRISEVSMKTVKVVSRLSLAGEDDDVGSFPKTFVANGRDYVAFSVRTRDACLNNIEYGGSSNLVHGRLIATSVSNEPPSSGRRRLQEDVEEGPLVLEPEIIDLNNGQYEVRFRTEILANFSAYVAFGENCTWNGTHYESNSQCFALAYPEAAQSLPFSTQAPTITEETSGLGSAALAGIGVAAGVVAVCGSLMLFVGVRIRNQWRRDKRFIDEGKRVVAEKGVAYVGDNDLDALQNKLQATLHALQAERAKRLKEDDKQHVIDELLRQKGELQEMVRRIKIRQAGGDPNAPEEKHSLGNRMRKSFAASRVSRGASLFNPGSRVSRGASLFNSNAGEASAPNPLFTRLRESVSLRPKTSHQAVPFAQVVDEESK